MIQSTQVVLSDDFSNDAPLNPAVWDYNHWAPVNNPSFYGLTQIEQALPSVSNGALQLTLQTYNPTSNPPGTSFLGSEIISNQSFNPAAGGIVFTAVARLVNPVPGLVGGIFGYNYNSSTNLDNESDFELLSNDTAVNLAQTNVYSNQPLGAGNPQFVSDPSLTAYHTYTMEWLPNEVEWFIDGQLVRSSTIVPQGSMQFHLNFWAPASDWTDAFSSTLLPTASSSDNQIYTFHVASVSVGLLNSSPPNDLTHSSTSSGYNHFIDLYNFEAS